LFTAGTGTDQGGISGRIVNASLKVVIPAEMANTTLRELFKRRRAGVVNKMSLFYSGKQTYSRQTWSGRQLICIRYQTDPIEIQQLFIDFRHRAPL
jgi:cephalosporin hydroxylase